MSHRIPLPRDLGGEFSVARARELGVSAGRLRASDLEMPFRGARMRLQDSVGSRSEEDRSRVYDRVRQQELALIRSLGHRLVPGQFLSHHSAALLWKAPLPWSPTPRLHVAVLRPAAQPRIGGVTGHSIVAGRCELRLLDGVPVVNPAGAWAMLADLPLVPLVALGDFFVRRYRSGWGRPNAGRPPLETLEGLKRVVALGRWKGQRNLERALPLIREDSWSPMESAVRVELVLGGLPEPALNIDLFDKNGDFLACVDLAYPEHRVVIEYQGETHAEQMSEDIERVERLRAAGWIVIQVTKALLARPGELVRRVRDELRSRGWRG